MKEKTLLELKKNSIKDTPKSSPTLNNIVELMEKEWPEMTKAVSYTHLRAHET